MDLSYITANHESVWPPARGGAFAHESFGDADQRNAACRRDVPAGRIGTHVKLRSCDLRGERSEPPIMRAHAGQDGALDARTLLVTAALVHQHRRAVFSEHA